jgi:glycosyltransferase involved in cell wall biosynthesis
MISICIPVYNFDVKQLVNDLHQQTTAAGIRFEILLVDDFSDPTYRKINRVLSGLENLLYEELSENIGRSRIRNYMAEKAQYPYLLFMDCDSLCPDSNFIKRYITEAYDERIVYGGRIYPANPPENDTYFHWLYGSSREVIPVKKRVKKKYNSFMTNNFMISQSLFSRFSFNEQLIGYGHEDTLFGFELMLGNVPIYHIDNPLLHSGLDGAQAFLTKSKQGILNLIRVYKLMLRDKDLVKMIRILRLYNIIRKVRLTRVIAWMFSFLEKTMEKNLLGKSPKLVVFDFYKLGYFCKEINSKD